MKLERIQEDVTSLWGTLADGWRQLAASATGALTRFIPGDKTNLPVASDIDDDTYFPSRSLAMLGGDVFEGPDRIVVRLETPGLSKEDFAIDVTDKTVVISGEKRFERESSQGRWRVMQCAYGSFRRTVPLPAAVKSDSAKATYKNGVLRVELAKATPGIPKGVKISVE